MMHNFVARTLEIKGIHLGQATSEIRNPHHSVRLCGTFEIVSCDYEERPVVYSPDNVNNLICDLRCNCGSTWWDPLVCCPSVARFVTDSDTTGSYHSVLIGMSKALKSTSAGI